LHDPFGLWTAISEVRQHHAMGANAEMAPMMPGARTQQHNAASPGLVLLILVLAALCASLTVVAFVVAPPGPAIGIGPLSVPEPVRVAAGITMLIFVALVCTANLVPTRSGFVDSVSAAPIVAAMVLGGPVAAALVAVLGTIEPREFRGVPWYGILANHGSSGIAAIVGGSVTVAVAAAVPGSDGLLAAGSLGGLVFVLVESATGIEMAAIRDHAGRAWFAAAMREQLSASRVGTIALGVLMAAAWLLSPLSLLLFAVPLYALRAALDEARKATEAEAMWRDLRQDRLTQLPNAQALDDRIVELRRAPVPGVCVLYLDLDGFKAINDRYDHNVGDDVLRVAATRLRATCRGSDFVARLHGDEFVILAQGVANDAEGEAVARRLVAAVEPPIEHPVGVLRVSATVGHRLVTDLEGIEEAIREADLEMARGKDVKAGAAGRVRSMH
jgi:diguanylate cyclase (GGDEF)-like protein